MKPIILRVAGWLAVAGLASCVGGFVQGGKPVTVQLDWQNGRLHTNYNEIRQSLHDTQRPDPAETPVVVEPPVETPTAPVESSLIPGESTPAESTPPAALPADAITPAQTPRGLQVEVLGGAVTINAGDSWSLVVENTDAYTARMDEGIWEIESVGRIADDDAIYTITVPRDTVLEELDLDIGAGSLFAGGIHCRSAEFSVGAGEMVMTDMTVEQDCDIEVGMGALSITGDLQRGVDIECGMGKVDCTLLRPQDFGYEIECGVGTVEFDGKSYAGLATEVTVNPRAAVQYDIECGMGSVTVVLTAQP